MKKLEMIELEPYEAPALEEIRTAVLLHGSAGDDDPTNTNPSGAPDPIDDPNPPDFD